MAEAKGREEVDNSEKVGTPYDWKKVDNNRERYIVLCCISIQWVDGVTYGERTGGINIMMLYIITIEQ